MDVFEAIGKRRSVRKFLDVPLPWEPVGQILEAGRHAPTAGNTQGVKFIVIVDPEQREKIAHACFDQFWMSKAPVHIVVAVDPTKTEQFYGKRGKEVYATQDAAAAAMSMVLAAEALGLASCWVAAFDEEKLKKVTGIPPQVQAQVVLPIGYADEKPKEPLKYSIESLVYMGQWGNVWIHMLELTGEYRRATEAALKKGKAMFEKAKEHLRRV